MKCVCPMGGDRTCPDNCLIAVWYGLPPDQRTKERRRPLVETLAKQGYTQEAIAMQLGVSHQTVGRDLETLSIVDNVKGQGKDTRGRKKSTGRPKGSSKKRETPVLDRARNIVRPLIHTDQPTHSRKLQNEHGISHVQFEAAIAVEKAQKEEPQIDASTLSMSAQEKLDIAIRQEKKKLMLEFAKRVSDDVRRRIDEIVLPHWKDQIDEAKKLYDRRRALMTKDTFNTIRRALHPDSRNSISDKKLSEAFGAFMKLEKYLLDEKDSPTEFGDLPSNLAEWDKMRAKGKRRSQQQPVSRR
jgi:IS30 family transposase